MPKNIVTLPHDAQNIACMRVNYAGEIAAQGLYLGALMIETNPDLREFYFHALEEEFHHLEWCGQCVYGMGGKVSIFNPLWFAGGVGLGMISRVAGSGCALGFIAETERQVLKHLESHLHKTPPLDSVSRRVVCQMVEEEKAHGDEAKSRGASELPRVVCQAMDLMGKALTALSAWR